jgi:hypothetical protein
MACTRAPSTLHTKTEQITVSLLNDTTSSPGNAASRVDMSRLSNMDYDLFNDVQARMYSNASGLNYDADLYSSKHQLDGYQAHIPPWQMMPMDESCLHSRLGGSVSHGPQTPGASFSRLPVSDARSPASVQSTRRGSSVSFATMPEQSLTTSYDAYEYRPVMSDTLPMGSYTPDQRFARLALDQLPTQQTMHRRKGMADHASQQQWDFNTMTQEKLDAYGQGLSFIPPTSYLPCCL